MNIVLIENYDPNWPVLFAALRAKLAAALGDLAASIEHVGSTAVPGLAAKPILDIDVLLCSAEHLALAMERLSSLGYRHQGDLGIAGREAFATPSGDPPHHLYVCPPSSPASRRHILFRDHLRAHPGHAQAYADLKRRLAAQFSDDRVAYTEAKSNFIRSILQALDEPPRGPAPGLS